MLMPNISHLNELSHPHCFHISKSNMDQGAIVLDKKNIWSSQVRPRVMVALGEACSSRRALFGCELQKGMVWV